MFDVPTSKVRLESFELTPQHLNSVHQVIGQVKIGFDTEHGRSLRIQRLTNWCHCANDHPDRYPMRHPLLRATLFAHSL